jgi:hypothetical protein
MQVIRKRTAFELGGLILVLLDAVHVGLSHHFLLIHQDHLLFWLRRQKAQLALTQLHLRGSVPFVDRERCLSVQVRLIDGYSVRKDQASADGADGDGCDLLVAHCQSASDLLVDCGWDVRCVTRGVPIMDFIMSTCFLAILVSTISSTVSPRCLTRQERYPMQGVSRARCS